MRDKPVSFTIIKTLLIHRIRKFAAPAYLGSVLLFGAGVIDARADFLGDYAPKAFTLTNVGGGVDLLGNSTANGSALFSNLNTLVLTGTNDGSGIPGYTDLTVSAAFPGLFQFSYQFTTLDDPQYEYAGYLVGGNFVQLAGIDPNLPTSGFVSVPVSKGQLFGFRAGSVDSQGGLPAVLTITDFAAPVPEPGTFALLLTVVVAAGGRKLYLQKLDR